MTRVGRLRTLVGSRRFKLLVSAALLGLLLRTTDVGQIRAALAQARLAWVGLAFGAVVASQAVSAYRWALLARAVGFAEPYGRFCAYYFSGMYLNLFGPGTLAGDIGRVVFLAGGQRRAVAMGTVLADRVIGFIALLWIGAGAIVLLPNQPLPEPCRWLAVLALPLPIVGWLWGPRRFAQWLSPTNVWRARIERELAPYWHDRRLLATALGWSAVVHALQIGAQMLVARALGQRLPWAFFLIVVPLVNAAGTLPISLQGVGLREAGYSYYLPRVGVPRAAALAIGLLTSAIVLAAGLSGWPAFLLLRQRAPAPALRRE